MIQRIVVITGLAAVVGLSGGLAVRAARSARLVSGQTAFTLRQTISYYNAAGLEHMSERSTHARRSDGSRVELAERSVDGKVYKSKRVYNIPSKRYTFVDHFTESTGTLPIDTEWLRNLAGDRGAACGDHIESRSADGSSFTQSSGHEDGRLLGLEVLKVTSELKDKRGVVRQETWMAPEIDCYPLRTATFHVGPNGTRGPRMVQEVIDVKRGEPDSELFVIPSGYVERPPSAIVAEYHRKKGDPVCLECGGFARSDERYRRLNSRPRP